jgi:hypothetical protein
MDSWLVYASSPLKSPKSARMSAVLVSVAQPTNGKELREIAALQVLLVHPHRCHQKGKTHCPISHHHRPAWQRKFFVAFKN